MEFLREIRTAFNLTQDEVTQKLMLNDKTIVYQYETRATPILSVLIKYSKAFSLSLDFIIVNHNCIYPRNLRLLELAMQIDNTAQYKSRSLVEALVDVFIKENGKIEIKQDPADLELSPDFHSNLKSLRSQNKISQSDLANVLNVGRTAITQYEMKAFPTLENLQKLSSQFNISMHALVTGQKLNFQFTDGHFGKTILLADRVLSLEKHNYLIELMLEILKK